MTGIGKAGRPAGTLHDAFRSLPLAPLDRIVPGTALVLAPHPDDESLGCGGLIAESCLAGRPPLVVVATDGAGSHPNSPTRPAPRLRDQREAETRDAVACLGLPPDRLAFLRLPDTRAPTDGPELKQAVDRLGALAAAYGCDAILAPWRHDPHCDHEAAWRMAQVLAARAGHRLLAYPVWGWLIPPDTLLDAAQPEGWRLPIAAHLPAKTRAIRSHQTQYGTLIDDDPDGFRLPPALLSVFEAPFEVFLSS